MKQTFLFRQFDPRDANGGGDNDTVQDSAITVDQGEESVEDIDVEETEETVAEDVDADADEDLGDDLSDDEV